MSRVLDNQTNAVLLGKVDTYNDILRSGNVDRVAGVVAKLARLRDGRERIAGLVLRKREAHLPGKREADQFAR